MVNLNIRRKDVVECYMDILEFLFLILGIDYSLVGNWGNINVELKIKMRIFSSLKGF